MDVKPEWAQTLASGIAELGLDVSRAQQEKLLRYVGLLHKWNRAYNLTALRDPAKMVPYHLLDSLAVSAYLHGDRVLDVGTGPGLPGIPLAITQPQRTFTLLDSNGKKIRFVRQVVLELGLDNVQVAQVRAEAFHPQMPFQTITARAFAALPKILAMTRHLLVPGSRLLALKGRYPEEELAGLAQEGWLVEVSALQVPKLEAERHLICIRPPAPESAASEGAGPGSG